MTYLYCWIKAWLSEEEGQDLIEYVLIAGLISLVAVAAIITTGGGVSTVWTNLTTQLNAIPAG